jgi:hypothetical protein
MLPITVESAGLHIVGDSLTDRPSPAPLIDHFSTLLFFLAFPVWLCLQVLMERLVLHRYPRHAWGSRLMVAYAIGAVLLVLQFVIGVFYYHEKLSQSFLRGGLPTVAYAFLMAAVIHRLFPSARGKHGRGFLLLNFQEHSRYIYSCLFLLSVISLFLGHYVFLDPIISLSEPRQILRMVWAVVFSTGVFIPSKRLVMHQLLFGTALVLLIAFVIFLGIWGMA